MIFQYQYEITVKQFIQKLVPLTFQGIGIVNINGQGNIKNAYVHGDLRFHQDTPIKEM